MNTVDTKPYLLGRFSGQHLIGNPYSHAVIILLAVVAAYQHLFQVYFLSDDFNLLTGSSRWLSTGEEFFRPIPHLLINLFYRFFGLNFFPYHFLSLLLHYANALLVYRILRKLIENNYFALAGSLFFAVNFLISETVFWISAVTSLLVTFFYLLGICFYLDYMNGKVNDPAGPARPVKPVNPANPANPAKPAPSRPVKSRKLFYILALLSLVLALGCKEDAVTFPAALLLFDLGCNRETSFKQRIRAAGRRILPFILLTGVYLFFKAASIAAAMSADTLSIGYHNLRNWRHLLLSLFTLNPFYDLPFLVIDRGLVNLFLTNPVEASAVPLDVKFFTFLLTGTVLIVLCLYQVFKGSRRVKYFFLIFTVSMGPFIFMTSHHLPFKGYYLYPLRLYYLPAACFFIFIILLLERAIALVKKKERFAKLMTPLLVFVMLTVTVSEIARVRAKNGDWLFASTIARAVTGQLGNFLDVSAGDGVSPGSANTGVKTEQTVILFNLPDSYRGAYIFRNGIQSAVRIFYPSAPVHIEVWKKNPALYPYPGPGNRPGQEKILLIDCSEAKLKYFVPAGGFE